MFPFTAVTVAVEDDALVVADGALHQFDNGGVEILRILQLVGIAFQLFGNCGVQHDVCVSDAHGASRHAEFEFIAGERERRGAVAVGRILGERGQDIHTQLHARFGRGNVVRAGGDGFNDGFQLLAHKNRDDGRRRFIGAQTMVVARGGDGHTEQVLILVHSLDYGREEQQELQVFHGRFAWVQQIFRGCGDAPVVVLAAAVHAVEGFFMQ